MLEAIYLNHAGTSWPKPEVVQNAVRTSLKSSPSDWPVLFEKAHAAIADFFRLTRSEDLLLTPGCTSALHTAVHNLDLAKGSRVLTSSWEHHALYAPLRKLSDRGIGLKTIPPDEPTSFDLNFLETELKAGDVGLVALTAACNVTGDLLPISDIIALAHRYGALVLIDAAQIVGWIELDLEAMQADIVAFGGHKGLQAPWGIGGLYTADTTRMKCINSTCELPSKRPSSSSPVNESNHRPSYCDVGSVDQVSLAALQAAIGWLADQDSPSLLSKARRQIDRLQSTIEEADHTQVRAAEPVDQRLPTIAFGVANCSSSKVAALLNQNGLVAASGHQCSPLSHESLGTAEDGLVRLSVGVGQADEEIDWAIEILKNVLLSLT